MYGLDNKISQNISNQLITFVISFDVTKMMSTAIRSLITETYFQSLRLHFWTQDCSRQATSTKPRQLSLTYCKGVLTQNYVCVFFRVCRYLFQNCAKMSEHLSSQVLLAVYIKTYTDNFPQSYAKIPNALR